MRKKAKSVLAAALLFGMLTASIGVPPGRFGAPVQFRFSIINASDDVLALKHTGGFEVRIDRIGGTGRMPQESRCLSGAV